LNYIIIKPVKAQLYDKFKTTICQE